MASKKEIEEAVCVLFSLYAHTTLNCRLTLTYYHEYTQQVQQYTESEKKALRGRKSVRVCVFFYLVHHTYNNNNNNVKIITGFFDIYDKDSSNYIDVDELGMILKKVGRDSAQGISLSLSLSSPNTHTHIHTHST